MIGLYSDQFINGDGIFAGPDDEQPVTTVETFYRGYSNVKPKVKKKKSRVIRFSDFESRDQYEKELEEAARALAAEAIPVSSVSAAPITTATVEDDDLEDDELILMALIRVMH